MTTQSEELQTILRHYIGSDTVYRHSINRTVLYSEGVQYFAEHAGAYWLLDILATQPEILKQAESFAVIKFEAFDDLSGILTVEDGNDFVVYTKKIAFTDAPLGVWKFYFTNHVIMLPSEY